MRVLHVLGSSGRGRGAAHLLGLLPELGARDITCEAAVDANSPLIQNLRTLGLPVQALEAIGSGLDPRAAGSVRAALRSAAPDLVHWHGTRAAFFGSLTSEPLDPPAVYTVHGLAHRRDAWPPVRWALGTAEAMACMRASRVLSGARADLNQLVREGWLARERAVHLPNAVDIARFRPGNRDAARRALRLPHNAFVVGTVSRLVPQKAVADLIEAAGALPEAVVAVAGDGPEREELERLARAHNGRVRFLGQPEDVPLVLHALDLFVLTSRWESEPIALLEAMACGTPCLATATSGARELLEGSGAGELVPVGNPRAIAAAMRRLALDVARREAMAKAGPAAATARTYAGTAARLAALYEAVWTECDHARSVPLGARSTVPRAVATHADAGAAGPAARAPVLPGLSVSLPSVDHAETLVSVIDQLIPALDRTAARYEVIVVDDESRDRTPQVVEELARRFGGRVRGIRHAARSGHGASLRSGFEAAAYEVVFHSDPGGQFDFTELRSFVGPIARDEADAVVGWRAPSRDPLARRVCGALWGMLAAAVLGVRARDVGCGFVAIRSAHARELALTARGGCVSAEMIVRLGRAGARIVERPVAHRPPRRGASAGGSPRAMLATLSELLAVRRALAVSARSGP